MSKCKVYFGDIDLSKFSQNPTMFRDEDGILDTIDYDIVQGDVYFGFGEDLTVLNKVRRIHGHLDLSESDIETLHGLENLIWVESIDITGCEHLNSFDGINPYIYFSGTSKIYPPEREKEFLDYLESVKIKKVFDFFKSL